MRIDFPSRARRLAAPLYMLGLVTACGDGATAPEQFDPAGTVSFTYSGARTGTFVASGVMEPPDSALATPVTGATAVLSEGIIGVVAFRSASGEQGDLFLMSMGEVEGPGTLQLGVVACDEQSAAACRTAVFLPDVSLTALSETEDPIVFMEQAYVVVLGALNVTAKTQLRIRGTFEGTAARAVEQGMAGTLFIRGSFDLPVRTE